MNEFIKKINLTKQTFGSVFYSFEQWKQFILEPLLELNNGYVDWLDDKSTIYTQEQIYMRLYREFNYLVFKTSDFVQNLNNITSILEVELQSLYVRSLGLIDNALSQFKDKKKQNKYSYSEMTGKNKQKQSVVPTDLTVRDDLGDMPITQADFQEQFSGSTNYSVDELQIIKKMLSFELPNLFLPLKEKMSVLFSQFLDKKDEVDPVNKEFAHINSDIANLYEKNERLETIINNIINNENIDFEKLFQKIEDLDIDKIKESIKEETNNRISADNILENSILEEKENRINADENLKTEILANTGLITDTRETIKKAFTINDKTTINQLTEYNTSSESNDLELVNKKFLKENGGGNVNIDTTSLAKLNQVNFFKEINYFEAATVFTKSNSDGTSNSYQIQPSSEKGTVEFRLNRIAGPGEVYSYFYQKIDGTSLINTFPQQNTTMTMYCNQLPSINYKVANNHFFTISFYGDGINYTKSDNTVTKILMQSDINKKQSNKNVSWQLLKNNTLLKVDLDTTDNIYNDVLNNLEYAIDYFNISIVLTDGRIVSTKATSCVINNNQTSFSFYLTLDAFFSTAIQQVLIFFKKLGN